MIDVARFFHRRIGDPFRAAFVLCAIAAVVPIWCVRYLPMVDLPQHAALLSVLAHYRDPAYGFASQFEIRWLTPYILPMLVGRVFAAVVGVNVALKLLISAYILGLPLALLRVLRRFPAFDPWIALAAFPFAYNLGFFWGFISFLFALPVGLWFFSIALEHLGRPTFVSALVLCGAGVVLFFCHAIVFGMMVVLYVVQLAAHGPARLRWNHVWPLAPVLVLTAVWYAGSYGGEGAVGSQRVWSFAPWHRLVTGPDYLTAAQPDTVSHMVAWATLILIAADTRIPFATSRRAVPFVVLAAIYLVIPESDSLVTLIYQRLAILVFLFFAVARVSSGVTWRQTLFRSGVVVASVAWSTVLVVRFVAFGAEGAAVRRLLALVPPNRTLAYGARTIGANYGVPDPTTHLPAWYQAEKGGRLSFTFACFTNSIVRLKPGAAVVSPWIGRELQGIPERDLGGAESAFEFYLLHSFNEEPSVVWPTKNPLPLRARDGDWWLYAKPGH